MKAKEKSKLVLASLVAAAFSLAAATANASVTDWGVHEAVETASAVVPVGSFDDIYSFTLSSLVNAGSTAVSNKLAFGGDDFLQITGGVVNLFKGTFGDATPDTLKLSYAFGPTTGADVHTINNLDNGSYYYSISGNAVGSHGGFYTLSSGLMAPVPEPETYGMLMAGLGLMGFVARKRSKNS